MTSDTDVIKIYNFICNILQYGKYLTKYKKK
jgi:hypothetical protein